MNDLASALLPMLGVGGVTGFAALMARAWLQALRATADVSAEKNRTIDRQTGTIERQDAEIENLQLQLLAALRETGAQAVTIRDRDMTIARLQAELARATGTTS
jgi:hypothetical protein